MKEQKNYGKKNGTSNRGDFHQRRSNGIKPQYGRKNAGKAENAVQDKSVHRNNSSSDEQDYIVNENLVSGRNSVTELLKSDRQVDVVYVSSEMLPKEMSYYEALARNKDAIVKRVHPLKLKTICGTDSNQGVAAIGAAVEYCEVEDILQTAHDRGEDPFIVIADGIEDPHNLGAIIRTAECAGVHGVIIPKRKGVNVTGTVVRSSAGATSYMKIARVANIASTVRELKEKNIFCYSADMDGGNCTECDLTGPAALVIGSEGFGVSRLVGELCDATVSLPMVGNVSSLNASVAAGILIYEIVRQRRK